MKKLIALFVALMLPLTALAAMVTDLTFDVDEMLGGGLIVAEDYPESWLVDDTGAAISPRYADVDEEDEFNLATVALVGEEINASGLIDTTNGAQVLPCQYGAVEVLSDRWIAGVVLTLSEDEDAPYYDWNGNHYDALRMDLYYRGALVATLEGTEAGTVDEVCGDYVSVITDANILWLNAAGEKRVCERSSDFRYEFEADYWTETIVHNGSGQQAFVPTCTLTAEQVSQAYTMTDAGIIDLQGNVVVAKDTLPAGARVDELHGDCLALYIYESDTATFRYGVMKLDGTMVIPFTAAKLPGENWFAHGVMPVVTLDGQLSYYDASGAVVATMPMPEGADVYDIDGFDTCNPIMLVEVDDKYSVLSATAGVVDVSAYEEVRQDWDGAWGLLSVKQNGKWGCIDMSGNLVVPCEMEYAPDTSRDNTRVLGVYRHPELGYIYRLYDLTK